MRVFSVNARSGDEVATMHFESSDEDVAGVTKLAAAAMPWLNRIGRLGRAQLLGELASSLEDCGTRLVAIADHETALGEARLSAELARTAYQLRFMGEVAIEGSYLDASIEQPGVTPLGPRPDLRRTSVPLGPIAVFGASNFPFAFSAPGGDTASALAAGCAVIVKAHGAHAATSLLVKEAFDTVLSRWGAPEGVFQLVFGRAAGVALVTDPHISAVGFTGSLAGGRELFNEAALRPEPIPFYGELGSVNPLVVTLSAARSQADELGTGIAGSMTLGRGQFCTKPGLFLIPTGANGDKVVAALIGALEQISAGHLLTDRIRAEFVTGIDGLTALDEVTVLHHGDIDERCVAPVLVSVLSSSLTAGHCDAIMGEYFGPFGVVIRYGSPHELQQVLAIFPPALTGTLHTAGDDDPELVEISELLRARSGRVVFNQYPTGVSVAWGMHHGGPYPASTSTATSVGSNSIKRWIRPIVYQNAPRSVLPEELRDQPLPGFARRINGQLRLG